MTDRVQHYGAKFTNNGVSAFCFDPPRAIDMKTETWVLKKSAVNCMACLRKLGSVNVGGTG